jgi:NADH:ubiquinone oxidoreductase subunit E
LAANAIGELMVLSAETHEQIRAEIALFPHARGALLYALHLAKAEVGMLGPEVYGEVGEHFDMRVGEVA